MSPTRPERKEFVLPRKTDPVLHRERWSPDDVVRWSLERPEPGRGSQDRRSGAGHRLRRGVDRARGRPRRRVDAFDVSETRVSEAQRLAAERGITNVCFEVASVDTYPLTRLSYDVTLFLAVYGKRIGTERRVAPSISSAFSTRPDASSSCGSGCRTRRGRRHVWAKSSMSAMTGASTPSASAGPAAASSLLPTTWSSPIAADPMPARDSCRCSRWFPRAPDRPSSREVGGLDL